MTSKFPGTNQMHLSMSALVEIAQDRLRSDLVAEGAPIRVTNVSVDTTAKTFIIEFTTDPDPATLPVKSITAGTAS